MASHDIEAALSEGRSSYAYFIRQALFAGIGIVAMIVISKIDYRIYKKFYLIAYIASILLLIAVMVIGKEANGAKRWIYITKSLSFQPSEFVKLFMIIFYATVLTKNKDNLKDFFNGWVKHLIMRTLQQAIILLHLRAVIPIYTIYIK